MYLKPDQVNVPVMASCDVPVITPDVERPTEGDIVIEKVNQNYQNRVFNFFYFNLDPK